MIGRSRSRNAFGHVRLVTARGGRTGISATSALVLSSLVALGCFDTPPDQPGTAGMTSTAGVGGATAGSGMGGVAGGGAGGVAGAGGAGTSGSGAAGTAGAGGTDAGAAGMSGAGGAGSAGDAGAAGAGAGGAAGSAGSAGAAGNSWAPPLLSETGLFTARGTEPGELVLVEGVREFEPLYWLWSDGADKKRYVYLPPGTQIDTTDADHWVFPVGTKFWKSFISNGQLVETRLIERFGDEPNEFRYATYQWRMVDSTDAELLGYDSLRMNASGTTHDIPSTPMCERCHNALKDHALGFAALQLNHDRPGVTLQTLLDENLLTVPIPTTIAVPGADQLTKDALGYLHANCGNCHNDSPGLPLDNVPEPQMLLRLSVNDLTLEDTDTFATAINQRTTAGPELGIDYRILGGAPEDSALYHRMGLRSSEGDQMPPIGSEVVDTEGGRATIEAWISSLPPPQ
jgi:hypothetical protein